MQGSSVDMPDPDGPITATIRADGISIETAPSAVTAVTPVPKTLVASTVRAAIAGAACATPLRVSTATARLLVTSPITNRAGKV
jgi:hypothetical protein